MKRHHAIILPRNFGKPKPKPSLTYNSSPKFLVLDISPIDFHFDVDIWFYHFYPPRAIIETVSRIPTYMDCDQALVDEIEHRLTKSQLDELDFDMMDLLISNVVTWFYEYVNLYLPDNIDSYVFDQWLDMRHNEIVMKRHDLY